MVRQIRRLLNSFGLLLAWYQGGFVKAFPPQQRKCDAGMRRILSESTRNLQRLRFTLRDKVKDNVTAPSFCSGYDFSKAPDERDAGCDSVLRQDHVPESWHRAPRMYVKAEVSDSCCSIHLPEDQIHYLLTVMRLREGNHVRIFDGINGEFLAAVTGTTTNREVGSRQRKRGRDAVTLKVERLLRPQMRACDVYRTPNVELMYAPIRKQRMKILTEKAVELGVAKLTPVLTVRTQVSASEIGKALEKMSGVAIEAAEQSERMDVPHVELTPATLPDVLRDIERKRSTNCARTILFVCKERDLDASPLLRALATSCRSDPLGIEREESVHGTEHVHENVASDHYAFLIGPEGGFEPAEIEMMRQFDFVHFVSLGHSVLRAESAAIYALSCWNAFWSAMYTQRE